MREMLVAVQQRDVGLLREAVLGAAPSAAMFFAFGITVPRASASVGADGWHRAVLCHLSSDLGPVAATGLAQLQAAPGRVAGGSCPARTRVSARPGR
jgi:hypothetical protein